MIYLVAFVLFMIAILWFIQTVFLDEFYERIKKKSVIEASEYIGKNLESEDVEALINGVSLQEEVSVSIIGSDGSISIRSDRSHDSVVSKLSGVEIQKLYLEASASKGGVLKVYRFLDRDMISEIESSRDDIKSIVNASVIKTNSGDEIFLVVDSIMTPVDSTVATLRTQLVYVTVVLIAVASALALLLSKKIADPIVEINRDAKRLSNRKYDIEFSGSGYREVVELKETLNDAVKELAKAELLQKEIIANISHDLKTPLTMIIGYSEAMRDLPGENNPENIQVVIDEANRLNRLVSDVLDISKLQSGTESLNLEKVNMTMLVKSTIERCARLTEAEGYSIEFHADKDIWVKADEVKISQVIYNLIGNAITHTGQDKKVSVILSERDGVARVTVKDTGEGIPEDKLESIWDRYYKLDKVHKRSKVGTGIGLSIVRSVVEMHGGKYGVKSEEGRGSEFWFEIGSE